jgi:hypothetical protein
MLCTCCQRSCAQQIIPHLLGICMQHQSGQVREQLLLDVILQAKLQHMDLGGTEDEGCDAPNMLTGTIPPSWGSMTQMTK